MGDLAQIILLLAVAVAVVVVFQRLRIPTSLGYLFVGVILGPFTVGPSVNVPGFAAIAEFGVVFLLFTIGLNYSLPQLVALRHQVLGMGTGQVVLTAAVVMLVLWMSGVALAPAFVFGAVFAQSSTTIIGSLLNEQNEDNTHHGRLGLALSVFQDVTAVPFLVIIPVLATSVSASVLGAALGWALVKAVLAFTAVFFAGRWLLRPLFQIVAARQSAEVFTLAVLLVALLAAWTTNSLGLSLAFGGFLAGMMLGETEFRHQVESTMRPFRDALLGLFFVSIGIRFDPFALLPIWHWAVIGALLIMLSKTLVVAGMLRRGNTDPETAWRTGLLLAVGGEFGLALVAIALDATVLDQTQGQIAMASVLLAMVGGALLVKFNGRIAQWLTRGRSNVSGAAITVPEMPEAPVIVAGYGRVGHAIAVLLHSSNIRFIAFDMDPARVALGRTEGHPVAFGDVSDREFLSAIKADKARLIVITIPGAAAALRTVNILTRFCPQVPVVARARDLETSSRLLKAGATQAYPEALEASLHLGEAALKLLEVDDEDIRQVVQDVRNWGYRAVDEPPA